MPRDLHKTIAATTLLAAILLEGSAGADEMLLRPLPVPPAPDVTLEREPASINLKLDFARILSFERPARTIIIGNPGVVDGTLSDENTMVLTGKAIGTTNMIILGEVGQEVASFIVTVTSNNSQLTTVHHGSEQQVYSCAGPCRPLLPPAGK